MQEKTVLLGSLAGPPGLENVADLTRDLDLLRHSFASVSRVQAACILLEHLTPQAVSADSAELSRLLAELTQSHAAMSVHEQHMNRVVHELQDAEAALRKWAEDHRICPTCGGELDPARVAKYAQIHGDTPHV